MKKVLFMAALVLVGANCFAQKANVRTAKNAALSSENPDFAAAREAILSALENEETKNVTETWWVAGLIGNKENEHLFAKQSIGQQIDETAKGEAVVESIKYWLVADSLSQIPNAKGKVDNKTRKNIAAKVLEYYTAQDLMRYAYTLDGKNNKRAYEICHLHNDIPSMPFMQDPKMQQQMPLDSNYYNYVLWEGDYATKAGLYPEAIAAFDRCKDNQDAKIAALAYQYLHRVYTEQKDTANIVATLEAGIKLFPDRPYFLLNLVNHYIFAGQTEEAITYLNKAIEQDPKNVQFYSIKGSLFLQINEFEKAIAAFDEALAIDPNSAQTLYEKGRAYFNHGVKIQEDAVQETDNSVYNKKMAQADEYYKQSLPFFEKAHELDGANVDYMQALKQIYYRLEMIDEYRAINEKLAQ